MTSEPITLDELLAELGASPNVDGYQTALELGELWKCSYDKVKRVLRRALEANRLESARRPIQGIDGAMRMTPVYRIKPAKPTKASRSK